jgi:hypothetical protein
MKIKTADLIGPALDWAVAKSEGLNPNSDPKIRRQYVGYSGFAEANGFGYAIKHYSTDWSQGGPIIERKWLDITPWPNESDEGLRWQCHQYDAPNPYQMVGPTPLIAAMRCHVTSELGDEVEIPEELL